MFSQEVMNVLYTLNSIIDLKDHEEDLDTMTSTNWKYEIKRNGKRSEDLVRENTARGLGAEIALQNTGFFEQSSPITENATGLTFAQRKKDVKCEGYSGEVKTMSHKYPWWYISESQGQSILYSTRFNDFFLIVATEQIESLKYRYKPKFLIYNRDFSKYIIKNIGGYSPYKFNHPVAIKDGVCLDLWSSK